LRQYDSVFSGLALFQAFLAAALRSAFSKYQALRDKDNRSLLASAQALIEALRFSLFSSCLLKEYYYRLI
jgi:hypothetical protein